MKPRAGTKRGKYLGRSSLVGAKKPATAFFIAHFDQRSHFLYRAFQEGVEGVSGQLSRQIQLQRVDSLPAEPDLVAAIKKSLNSAVLAICDITPSGPGDQPQWNPNVFYELGMAEQLGLPTFLVCDKERQPTKTVRLPFDIVTRAVEYYDFTPNGLELIKERLGRWLLQELDNEKGRMSAYEQSQQFVRAAREIKDALYKWHGASAASFRQLLARMVTPLQSEAAKMTRFINEMPGSAYRFQPPGRSDAVEQLFIAMIESLEPGDEYLTLSTLPFWRSFAEDGDAYRESCRKAAERGVFIRRIMIVPENCDEDEKRIVQAHFRAYKSVESTYELRISRVPRPQSLLPKGHVGVCHRKELGVTTAFQPDYGDTADPPRVIAIRLRDDADDAAREFEERWEKTPRLGPELVLD